jgi:hypothetical protein
MKHIAKVKGIHTQLKADSPIEAGLKSVIPTGFILDYLAYLDQPSHFSPHTITTV